MDINSCALYITRTMSSVSLDRSEVQKLYCTVEFSVIEASKLVTTEVESHSQTPYHPSLVYEYTQCRLCTHYNDDLYHIHRYHFHYMQLLSFYCYSI